MVERMARNAILLVSLPPMVVMLLVTSSHNNANEYKYATLGHQHADSAYLAETRLWQGTKASVDARGRSWLRRDAIKCVASWLLRDATECHPLNRSANIQVAVKIAPQAMDRVRRGRYVVDDIVRRGDVAYGINTGFGLFANV